VAQPKHLKESSTQTLVIGVPPKGVRVSSNPPAAFFAVMLLILLPGCVAPTTEASCAVSATDLQLLQSRTRLFLAKESKSNDVSCEELSDSVTYLPRYGCAIYGRPSGESSCPQVLDGDYFVVFRRKSLEPRTLVEVAH
jgi:hypothetical protein